MKLLTLNTHSLIEPDYEAKREIFVNFIAAEQPEVFALQEVNQTAAAPLLGDAPAGMINYLNPAAVTARDTLSFMLDFGVSGEGKMYEQGNVKSANNIFNIYDFMFTVPIYKSSALIAEIIRITACENDDIFRITRNIPLYFKHYARYDSGRYG